MKRVIFAFLLLSIALILRSQSLNKQNIDNWLIATFPHIKLDNKTYYIIDGLPLDDDNDSCRIVSRYKMSDIATINYIDSTTLAKSALSHKWNNIIIITTGQQDKNTIKQTITNCRKLFKKKKIVIIADINTDDKEPVLVVDGKQIYFKECYHIIISLEIKNIKSINYINKAVSVEMYGANGVNGLIIIKTKED